MSFIPDPEQFEELFALYRVSETERGLNAGQILELKSQFRQRLADIWNAIEPKPFPVTFDDFRRALLQEFRDRMRKDDPRFRRPKF
jgi:hypothetical protein